MLRNSWRSARRGRQGITPPLHAPGTKYVSFVFDPQLSYPLPAPGATIVLPIDPPLTAPFPVMKLGYYDRATDSTSFATDVYTAGEPPIIGTVSADGRLVTFEHVSHFSTLVGLAEDAAPPQVTAPASIQVTASETGGARGTNVPELAAFLAGGSATDNLDPAPERLAPQAGGIDLTNSSLFPAGATTTVTFRYRDSADNLGTAEATVTVTGIADTQAPTVTAPAPIEIAATEPGGTRGTASPQLASFLNAGSATDDTDPSPVRLDPLVDGEVADFTTLFPVGLTTVTFRYQDAAGNLGTANTTVRVTAPPDTVAPLVTAPAPITVSATAAGGTSGTASPALAAFLAAGTATDAVAPAPARLAPQVGGGDVDGATLFPLGTTSVTFRFQDDAGNVGSASATVTVVDDTAPTVTAPANLTLAGTEHGGASGASAPALAAFLAGGTAMDSVDSAPSRLAPQVGGVDASGATLFPLGTTTVNFRFQDAAGNSGTAAATVTVTDSTAPTVTPPAVIEIPATERFGATAAASPTLATFLAAGTAVDTVDPAPQRLAARSGGADITSATLFNIGTTTVTFRFRDSSGNVGESSARVRVVVGAPKLSAVATKGTSAGGYFVDIAFRNTGTGRLSQGKVGRVTLRTLAGSGTVTLASTLPLTIGDLDPGATASVRVYLTVPATVSRFSIVENGTLEDVSGKVYSFSLSQAVIR